MVARTRLNTTFICTLPVFTVQRLTETFLSLSRNQRDIITNAHRYTE